MLVERGKEVSFKLGFEIGQSGEILQIGRQTIPDRWNLVLPNRFQIPLWDFEKLLMDNDRLVKRAYPSGLAALCIDGTLSL